MSFLELRIASSSSTVNFRAYSGMMKLFVRYTGKHGITVNGVDNVLLI
jgi:hypothetical protein